MGGGGWGASVFTEAITTAGEEVVGASKSSQLAAGFLTGDNTASKPFKNTVLLDMV